MAHHPSEPAWAGAGGPLSGPDRGSGRGDGGSYAAVSPARYCAFCWADLPPSALECPDCGQSRAEMEAEQAARADADRGWVPPRRRAAVEAPGAEPAAGLAGAGAPLIPDAAAAPAFPPAEPSVRSRPAPAPGRQRRKARPPRDPGYPRVGAHPHPEGTRGRPPPGGCPGTRGAGAPRPERVRPELRLGDGARLVLLGLGVALLLAASAVLGGLAALMFRPW